MSKPYRREQILAEWRGLDYHPPKRDATVTVADVIGKLMASLGLGERLRQEEILKAWKEIVGEFIASHSNPTRLQNGVLYVQVLQPTMHYELDRVWKQKIIQKMRERFGARTIRDVKFRVG